MQKLNGLALCASFFIIGGSLQSAKAGNFPILGPMHQSALCAAFAEHDELNVVPPLEYYDIGRFSALLNHFKDAPTASNAAKAVAAISDNLDGYSFLETKSIDELAESFALATEIARPNVESPLDPNIAVQSALNEQAAKWNKGIKWKRFGAAGSGIINGLVGASAVLLEPNSALNIGLGIYLGGMAAWRFYTFFKTKLIHPTFPTLQRQEGIEWIGPVTQEDWLAELHSSASYQFVHGMHAFRVRDEDGTERFILAIPTSL